MLADRLAHLLAEELEEVLAAERGVVPPQLEGRAAAALAALHGARVARSARHHRAQLDDVVVADDLVAGDELVAADDEHRLGNDVELDEDLLHAALAAQLDLAPGIAQHDLHAWDLLGIGASPRLGRADYTQRRRRAQRSGP